MFRNAPMDPAHSLEDEQIATDVNLRLIHNRK